jgi:HAD superfamily hydrolase (TIGR01490 family)
MGLLSDGGGNRGASPARRPADAFAEARNSYPGGDPPDPHDLQQRSADQPPARTHDRPRASFTRRPLADFAAGRHIHSQAEHPDPGDHQQRSADQLPARTHYRPKASPAGHRIHSRAEHPDRDDQEQRAGDEAAGRGNQRSGSLALPSRLRGVRLRRGAALAGAASAAAAKVEQRAPIPDPTAAAFFDVDNTLMRGASIYHFARGLAARKMFGPRDLAEMAWKQVYFRVWGAENPDHIEAAREAALAFVAGHKVADIVALCEEIYDEVMADRIWEGTRELAQRHLEAGQRVWLVTATPVELASIIARRLGLTGALGTVAESVDGVYTGRLVGGLLHGPAKAAAIEALAAREGLDLARCSAYSDSENDLPMLRLVGHPAAVNPDAALRAEARASNWPVHDFRSGRKATLAALPVAAGAGALAGGIAAGLALRRRYIRG